MSLRFYETLAGLLRGGQRVAVATLVARHGSTPRGFGAKMIVSETGATHFSIGGGAFEALVIDDALQALRAGEGLEKDYRFTEQGDDATGMVCGGAARVLFEVILPPAPLLVFGGGHVGRALAQLGARLGFAVSVVDDRPRLLEAGHYPAGVRTVAAGPEFAAGLPEIPPGAYVAIVTRCHRTDLAAVCHAVGRGAAYVGLIGSRRKIATVLRRAEERGTPRGALRDVRGPIGLPIGAETPEEIAVSIAAEMIAVRRAAALASPAARRARRRAHDLSLPGAPPAPIPRPAPAPRCGFPRGCSQIGRVVHPGPVRRSCW
jgi:xanthine dehydrogenase accessory factor